MPEGPQGRAEVSGLLARHGLRPRRALGQHFLADPNVVRKVVRLAAVRPGDRVVEVGAGTGTLTRALAAAGALVVAYEVDRKLEPLLAEVLEGAADVAVRYEDVMKADLAAELEGEPWTMVANLPYHVGTPLVLDTLRTVPKVVRYVVMVQREVADRFGARPGSKSYGLPSVVVGLYGRLRPGFPVGPAVFVPPPAVESAVIVIERRQEIPAAAGRAVELAAAAFGQRRKTVRNSLARVIADPERALAAAGIDPAARADHLTPEDFLWLAEVSGG